jgi:nucleotide-binding universal stress UspA family protein
MESLFKKILCPIEFDRIAIPAIKLALEIAHRNNATIHLLSVIPEDNADVKKVASDALRSVAHKWLEGKVRYDIAVRVGPPSESIIKAEEELGADLVVMATHGRTGERYDRIGSVAERVVRESTRPVMTIRPQ